MKTTLKIMSMVALSTTFMACNSNRTESSEMDSNSTDTSVMMDATSASVVPGEYTDLSTGKTVYIVADPETGYAVDSITRVPVEFYIDRSGDTLDRTGFVVNNAIMQTEGKWTLDETKIKRGRDDLKIKHSDGSKTKIEDDGDIKMKNADGSKIKVEEDTVKIKN